MASNISEKASIFGMFPGQGSQAVGMGVLAQEAFPEVRDLFARAGTLLGFPIADICRDGPLEELTKTAIAQPAILLTSYALYTISGIPLAAAAGHSLGEYTALVAAGVLSFEDALQLVHKRGRYMQEAVPQGEGKMSAVLGVEETHLEGVLAQVESGVVSIANNNCPGQIVIAGASAAVDQATALLQGEGAKVVALNVSAPFHCALMKPAAENLRADLQAITFNAPTFPVYSNVTARVISGGEEARELLEQQVCAPVRWSELVTQALSSHTVTHAVEFGGGNVLSNLLKRISPAVPRLQVSDPATLQKTRDSLSTFGE